MHEFAGRIKCVNANCAKRSRVRATLLVLSVLILALCAGFTLAAQTAPSSGTHADINKQIQAAYQAGSAAFANSDFKTAETEFEKIVQLAPQIEEDRFRCGPPSQVDLPVD
jgi:Tfp pilus assembly protein PilF